jgi:hypothetical protein
MTDRHKKDESEAVPEPEDEITAAPEDEITPEPEPTEEETEPEPEPTEDETTPEPESETEAEEPKAEDVEELGSPPEEIAEEEALPEPVPPKVKVTTSVVGPIETLKLGETFTLDGELYRLFSKEKDYAIAAKVEKSPDGEDWIDRWQRPVLYGTEIEVTPV